MRALVDSSERRKDEIGALVTHAPNDFLDDVTIDVEPATHVAAEVRARDARRRTECAQAPDAERGDAAFRGQSATDHAERADAALGELEYRRCRRVEIAVDAPHLMANVTARKRGKGAGRATSIEPAQARQADRSRIPAHQKWRIGGPRHRRKTGGDGEKRTLVSQA